MATREHEPDSGATSILALVREQVEFRELLLAIVRRDLALRYRNAVLGFGWAVAVPLLFMLIFNVVFTRIAPLDTGVPYPIYAYAGLLPWSLFASAQRFAALSLTSNPHLVTKIYFPREILPFSAVIVALIDYAVASVLLLGFMAYYGIGLTWAVLLLPVVLCVQLAFTAGVALLVAMGNLFYADVKYVLEPGLVAWMFGTSVLYPVERVGGLLGGLLALNPMTPIIEAHRSILVRGELPAAGSFLGVTIASLVVLTGAWVLFHRAEFRFAEEI